MRSPAPVPDLSKLHIRIGGVDATVMYAGMVAAGEFQIDVVVPPVAAGDQPIVAEIGGYSTQPGALLPAGNCEQGGFACPGRLKRAPPYNWGMSPTEGTIEHVSDTALLTAACRAMESERPGGLVHDPFAARLAGERGMAIAHAVPGLEMMCFGVGIRSRFLDDLVADAVAARGVRTVVSVGCGLDARPYRLDLPADLHWIEVDFQPMLDYKSAVLAAESPKCRLERLAADINASSGRDAVFAAAGGAPVLMITEGLLMYLPAETVEALAAERTSGVRYWLVDLTSSEMARRAGMDSREAIQKVRAAGHLDGNAIFGVLQRNGWASIVHRNYTTDAWKVAQDRIRAILRNAPPAAQPLPDGDPSGIHLFARA